MLTLFLNCLATFILSFTGFFSSSNTATQERYMHVNEKCSPFVCRKECLDYVRRLKSSSCFTGDVGSYLRLSSLWYSSKEGRLALTEWFSKLDSCDWELWSAGYTKEGYLSTSGASLPSAALSFAGIVFLFTLLVKN